jgi:transcriptional regulator with XRE-family HTH domain
MSQTIHRSGLTPAILKRRRLAAGLRQEDLARLSGYGQPFVSKLELGTATGSHRVWRDLARALEES